LILDDDEGHWTKLGENSPWALAWDHFVEGRGLHPHQQAKCVTSMMDDDNDSWAKLGEGIPLALDEFVEE